MATPKKNPRYVTPRGRLFFPALQEPDTKFDPNKPVYKTGLLLDANAPETLALIETLQAYFDEAEEAARVGFEELKPAAKKKLGEYKMHPFYEEVLDDDTGDPTGDVRFNFKTNAFMTYKKGPKAGQTVENKVRIIDAKKKPFPKNVPIWGGSEARIQFDVAPFFVPGTGLGGLSLRMNVVQIIELNSSVTGGGLDQFDEEDGFDASELSEEETQNPKTKQASPQESADEDDTDDTEDDF